MSDIQNVEEKPPVSKGGIFGLAVVVYAALYVAGYFGYVLVQTTYSALPLIAVIGLAILTLWLAKRVSDMYPGSAKVIALAMFTLSLTIFVPIALSVVSTEGSFTDSHIAPAILALFYPFFALGYPRASEVFMTTLGIDDGGDSKLEHIDTLYVRKSKSESAEVPTERISLTLSDSSTLDGVAWNEPDEIVTLGPDSKVLEEKLYYATGEDGWKTEGHDTPEEAVVALEAHEAEVAREAEGGAQQDETLVEEVLSETPAAEEDTKTSPVTLVSAQKGSEVYEINLDDSEENPSVSPAPVTEDEVDVESVPEDKPKPVRKPRARKKPTS